MRLVALLSLASFSLSAWNNTGHKVVATIAYKRLNANARARVDALLARHPDYDRYFTRGAPADPDQRALYVFQVAATWPDIIRGDPRLWDDTKPDSQPTPNIPGFPDSKRHTNWHYKDIPFSPDGTPTIEQQPPHALSELVRMMGLLGKPPGDATNPSYLLPWFLHLAGDVHQPLHCVSRFTKSEPKGDAGGNGVWVAPGIRLHALWDEAAGRDDNFIPVVDLAAAIVREHPTPGKLSTNPAVWIKEGFEIAKSDVYTFGNENGTREMPIALSADYLSKSAQVSRGRIALAGYRITRILNEKLK